eukprot:g13299.t1
MALPPADGWRRAIVRVLQARRSGEREPYKAAMGHLFTYNYLSDDTKAQAMAKIYRSDPAEDDSAMMDNLQELLCGPTGLAPHQDEKSIMMGLFTALLLVELGRDKSGAYNAERDKVIDSMPPKRVKRVLMIGDLASLGLHGLSSFMGGVKIFLANVSESRLDEEDKQDAVDAKKAFDELEQRVTALTANFQSQQHINGEYESAGKRHRGGRATTSSQYTAIHGVNLSPSARSTTTLPPTPPSWSSSGTRVPAVPTQASTPPPFLKRGRSPAYGLFAATSPATASTAPSPWGTPSSWAAPPSHSSTAQPPVMATPRVACTGASSGMAAAVTSTPATATGTTAVAAPKMVGGFVGWAPTNDGTSGLAPLAAPAVCNPPATASIGGAHTPVAGGIRGSTATATATAGPNPSPASRPASDAAASLAVSASSASSEIGSAHVDVLADMLSSTLKIEHTTSPQVTAASDASRKAFDNLMEVDTNADTDATAMMAQALALKMTGLSLKGVGGSKGDNTPSTEEVSAESAFVRAMRAVKEEQSRERLANMMQADPMYIEPHWMDVEEQSNEGLQRWFRGIRWISSQIGWTWIPTGWSGNEGLVKRLMKVAADVVPGMRTRHGLSALCAAAHGGNLSVISMVLNVGVDLDEISGEDSGTALMHAIMHHQEDAARFLLIKRGDVDVLDRHRNSALHCACDHGSPQLVRDLLGYGANPGIRNSAHDTPLHVAVNNERAEIVSTLVSDVDDRESIVNATNFAGNIPLVTTVEGY